MPEDLHALFGRQGIMLGVMTAMVMIFTAGCVAVPPTEMPTATLTTTPLSTATLSPTPSPTTAPSPTATLDLAATATQMQAETQTPAAAKTVTQAMMATQVRETRAAEETNLALTPSKTLTRTPTPSQTAIPITSFSASGGKCHPSRARAGLIVITWEGGTNIGLDAATASIGDTAATVTFNGRPATPLSYDPFTNKPLTSKGRNEIGLQHNEYWGARTFLQIMLGPGEYKVEGDWVYADGYPHPVSCTLTVVGP